MRCPKCQGDMEKGFIRGEGGSIVYRHQWIEGEPETQFFSGVVKRKGKKVAEVLTYRCAQCGYLEFFAHDVQP